MKDTVSFENLPTADLIIDAVYRGGSAGHVGDDPISKLLPCGNQGGIRFKKEGVHYTLAVLYTSGHDPDWPDVLDPQTGLFTYYGDNKTPGKDLHNTVKNGNVLLRDSFAAVHATPSDRSASPPFFLFEKVGSGRDVRFLGLAVPGGASLSSRDDLVAIWRSTEGARFQNYRATFTVLDVAVVPRTWLDNLANGKPLSDAPSAWKKWYTSGEIRPLMAPSTLMIRSKEEQLPSSAIDEAILKAVYSHFKDRPHDFERCAVEIWKMLDPNVGKVELTRQTRDGGRDAYGTYQIGPPSDRLNLDFALEAKCWDRNNGLGVRPTSRLISRLKIRQFGVLVTTSYVNTQAYTEIREDMHPVVVISGGDIASILKLHGHADATEVQNWLDINFPAPIESES